MITVWRRSETKVNCLLGRMRTCFPPEIMEMIIIHLTHDLGTLKACALTSRSWYIVAASHLHHTLTLGKRPRFIVDKRNRPFIHDNLEPLSRLHELGLMPLVKEVRAEQWGDNRWFVPQAFSNRDLGYFSALTNVRTLKIQRMEVYRFVLDIEHYFGHLSPTLRSIKLFYPSCTPLQLSHFLSFFSSRMISRSSGSTDTYLTQPSPTQSSSHSPHRDFRGG